MPNRRLNHCCCFTVREGSLILGVVGMVGGLIAAITGTILLLKLLHSGGFVITQKLVSKCLLLSLNFPDIKPAENKYEGLIGWCEHNLEVVFAMTAAVGMVTVACNILLVIGVRKRDPCLMRPWIALCFTYLSIMTLGVGKALFYRGVPVKVRPVRPFLVSSVTFMHRAEQILACYRYRTILHCKD